MANSKTDKSAAIGDAVLFNPIDEETRAPHPEGVALSAVIAFINEDETVNLGVLDQHGVSFAVENVPLLKDGDEAPGTSYAEYAGRKAAEKKDEPKGDANAVDGPVIPQAQQQPDAAAGSEGGKAG